jgi:thiamine biosynthesis protein ThiS
MKKGRKGHKTAPNAYFKEAMKIQLNGAPAELDPPLTLSGLLARHKLKPETVVVEYNLRVPEKREYDAIRLQDGDRVEIVKFMGGG